jgi:hypothetical protein
LLVAGILVKPVSSDGHSLDLNINLIWGTVLLVFGLICLLAARTGARKQRKHRARPNLPG